MRSEERAIVQISIKHPMACAVQRNADLARYASEVARATLLLVTSADDPLLSGQRCGGWDDTGTGKSVRFAKFWAVRNALRSYDEVALMDDTLVVNRASPNIFTIRSRSGVVGAKDHFPRTRSCGNTACRRASASLGSRSTRDYSSFGALSTCTCSRECPVTTGGHSPSGIPTRATITTSLYSTPCCSSSMRRFMTSTSARGSAPSLTSHPSTRDHPPALWCKGVGCGRTTRVPMRAYAWRMSREAQAASENISCADCRMCSAAHAVRSWRPGTGREHSTTTSQRGRDMKADCLSR